MSCMFLSDKHLSTVAALIAEHIVRRDDACYQTEFGNWLLRDVTWDGGIWPPTVEQVGEAVANYLSAVNEAAYCERYAHHDDVTQDSHAVDYCPAQVGRVQAVKLVDCLDYQACDWSDYRESLACKLLERLRKHLTTEHQAWRDAEWTI